MKNYFDLDKKEQKKLKAEFRKKHHSIRLGIIIGGLIGGLFLIIDYYLLTHELLDKYGNYLYIGFFIVLATTCIVVGINEENTFKTWLKSRRIEK